MRAGAFAVGLAICLAAVAAVWDARPFDVPFHTWQVTLVIALGGALLGYQGVATLRSPQRHERFAALAAFGGALCAGTLLQAAFAAGPPSRAFGVPAQAFRPSPHSSVAIEFPAISQTARAGGAWPDAITLAGLGKRTTLSVGQTVQVGPYVFRALRGPIAFVSVRSPDGRSVTVTQPEGAAFASPYLVFPLLSGDQPADLFAAPALHRVVRVAYYAGLPARNISIPFVLMEISEENGGVLYQGVAVSGRPVKKAGMILDFQLGEYPAVIMASAPAPIPFAVALLMIAISFVGYVWSMLIHRAHGTIR